MDLAKHQGTLADWLATQSGLVAELARDELADIIRLTEAIKALGTRIGERVRGPPRRCWRCPAVGADRGQARRRVRRHHQVQSEAAFARHAGWRRSRCGLATPPGGSG